MLRKLIEIMSDILGYKGTVNNVNEMFKMADELEAIVDKLNAENRYDEANRLKSEIQNSISILQYHLMMRLNEITAKGGDFIEI